MLSVPLRKGSKEQITKTRWTRWFEPTGTFIDGRLPVDSVDPVLMARQDRLQGHGEATGHICSRAKALNDNCTNDEQRV